MPKILIFLQKCISPPHWMYCLWPKTASQLKWGWEWKNIRGVPNLPLENNSPHLGAPYSLALGWKQTPKWKQMWSGWELLNTNVYSVFSSILSFSLAILCPFLWPSITRWGLGGGKMTVKQCGKVEKCSRISHQDYDEPKVELRSGHINRWLTQRSKFTKNMDSDGAVCLGFWDALPSR